MRCPQGLGGLGRFVFPFEPASIWGKEPPPVLSGSPTSRTGEVGGMHSTGAQVLRSGQGDRQTWASSSRKLAGLCAQEGFLEEEADKGLGRCSDRAEGSGEHRSKELTLRAPLPTPTGVSSLGRFRTSWHELST